MDIIRLTKMIFYAHHGFYEAERELGQKFEVDIELEYDLSRAAREDDLTKTIDYTAVYKITKNIFENYKFKLIETAAERIAEKILQLPGVPAVRVAVRKPHAQVNGLLDHVEIEIYREETG